MKSLDSSVSEALLFRAITGNLYLGCWIVKDDLSFKGELVFCCLVFEFLSHFLLLVLIRCSLNYFVWWLELYLFDFVVFEYHLMEVS